MKRKFPYLLTISLMLSACTNYKMPNLMGDYVDVTEMVTEEGYQPIYCGPGNEICALKKNPPIPLPAECGADLRKGFKEWIKQTVPGTDHSIVDTLSVIKLSQYQYTYFISYNPIHVYETVITFGSDTTSGFFRVDKGKVILPYDVDGWVIY